MHAMTTIASLLLLAISATAAAQQTLPPVQATQFVVDCERMAMPSQRQVGEWTGLQNFGQVYHARLQLVARIGHACRRPGIDRVQVVTNAVPDAADRALAVAFEPR